MQKEIEELRRKYREGRFRLFQGVSWASPSRNLLEAHTALIDSLIKDIYELSAQDADGKTSRGSRSGLAIVATGGYGRRELSPYSDVDIAFIPSEEEDPWVEAVVHTAFKLVMDVFLSLKDVQVGYSFRPISEASAWDVSVKTSLLDLRAVCGESALAEKLKRRVREVLPVLDLVLDMAPASDPPRGQAQSIYTVEPNLKEGPGALRDLHCGRWIYKLFYGVDDPDLVPALQKRGGMSDWQVAELREAADWFWRARNWLHLASGKRSDVLINNYQDRIARELGECGAQEWLSRHLKYAEVLEGFRKNAVRTVLMGPLDIRELKLEDGALHVPHPFPRPDTTLFAFHTSQRHSLPISLKDQKRLSGKRSLASMVQDPSDQEAGIFKRILSENRDLSATVRVLAEFGYMDRFVPKFTEAMRFVPPDPAHSHTVGEHSIRIIEHLERLRAGQNSQGQRFRDLLNQCAHFDMLCLAALLHDIGKLLPGGDHCESGAELAGAVSRRLKLSAEKKELLDALVRQHLLLVRTARLQDLTSAGVIQRVAALVPSLESLKHLYVFTYVDTCAVSDTNWTSMDDRDLEDLFRKMRNFFAGSWDDTPGALDPEEKIGLIRKRLVALNPLENERAVLKHTDTMPASYLLNTSLEDIANHLQLLERLKRERIVLDVYNRPGEDYSELTICTPDDSRPGLLSKITGVLYGCETEILKAQAYTIARKNSVVLDTLYIQSNGMQISEHRARKIQAALKEVLTGTRELEEFFTQSGKTPPAGIALDSLDLRNDLSEEHTVVHIIAGDHPGLLYVMCRSLARCGLYIHSAKIATWHARAENNFYVTTDDGTQISEPDLAARTEQLRTVLQGPVDRYAEPGQSAEKAREARPPERR
ncbi:MAG: HD domain-containing protein [Acidobacteria bacterium]|nr:HD domain-containing protein [Acidobacteriota bacterium]